MNRIAAASAAALGWLLCAGGAAAQSPALSVGGAPVSGRLEASDPQLGDREHHDDYRVELRAGHRVRLSLDSEDFDPVLLIYRAGALDEAVAENDDGPEGLNSRLTFSAPSDGSYVVRVMSFEPGEHGGYSLRAEALPPLPAPVTAPNGTDTGSWRVFRGELTAQDPDNDGTYFDDFQVTLSEGEQVIVRADSDAFDPLVQIYAAAARGGEPLEIDDDTGAGTNALLGFEAPEAGAYIVRVTAYSSGSTGGYTLRIGN